jgi:pyruvate/oxaloacetate carboxyltransferase
MAKTIRFTDLTLRDGQQSLAATRMTTPQALRVLKMIDDTGFASMELWGGATLDSSIRFLEEDPWERLEIFRDTLGGPQKVQALLRGQNLFAYQPYPDDLVIAFVKQAVSSGVGIMRIFDALNDWRNLQIALLATKAYGAKAEAAISYTTSPVHTTGYFVNYARKLVEEGADQIAIKDMSGILFPTNAAELIAGLRQAVSVPIALHTHSTAGVSLLNCVIGMHAGIDTIDTAITPFAGGSSHTPIEILLVFAEEYGLQHGLDKPLLLKIQAELFKIFEELSKFIPYAGKFYRPLKYEDVDRKVVNQVLRLVDSGGQENILNALDLTRALMDGLGYPDYDHRIFDSQIPGGMLTNLVNQLKEMGRPEIYDEVMAEIPQVRADVGYVPMVTPTSQIVGSQATFNVIFGERYSFVSNEFHMILKGEFGRTPAECNPEVVRKVLGENEEPLKYRAASYLHPVLEDPYDLPFVRTHKDLLLHLMLGQPADEFLRRRYNLNNIPQP